MLIHYTTTFLPGAIMLLDFYLFITLWFTCVSIYKYICLYIQWNHLLWTHWDQVKVDLVAEMSLFKGSCSETCSIFYHHHATALSIIEVVVYYMENKNLLDRINMEISVLYQMCKYYIVLGFILQHAIMLC